MSSEIKDRLMKYAIDILDKDRHNDLENLFE